MAEIEALTTELLQWAKRHARAEQRTYLVLDDLVVGAYALVVDGKIDATVFPGATHRKSLDGPTASPSTTGRPARSRRLMLRSNTMTESESS